MRPGQPRPNFLRTIANCIGGRVATIFDAIGRCLGLIADLIGLCFDRIGTRISGARRIVDDVSLIFESISLIFASVTHGIGAHFGIVLDIVSGLFIRRLVAACHQKQEAGAQHRSCH